MAYSLVSKNIILSSEEKERIVNSIFSLEVKQFNLSDVYFNINNFPKDYKNKILNYFYKNKKFKKYCLSFKNTLAKNIDNKLNLPTDIINLIFEYTIFIPEYVYIEIKEYSKFLAIQLLQKIIIDNEFDISWYCVDTLDYQWANDTIYNCNTIINNILENIS